MEWFFKNKKGESILETIIAMVILAMGITVSSTIIGLSLRNMNHSKNKIVAVNIAREGVEAMRNIRDTNWLKFNSKRRACWNHLPLQDPNEVCDGANPIEPGSYTIYKQQDTFRWRLTPLQGPGITDSDTMENFPPADTVEGSLYHSLDTDRTYQSNGLIWIDISTLYLVDIDPLVDTDGDHDYANDTDAYNPRIVLDDDAMGKNRAKETLFARRMKIEYLSNDGAIITSAGDNLNRMRITSTVTWMVGSKEFKTELVTHITDYIGRERLEG